MIDIINLMHHHYYWEFSTAICSLIRLNYEDTRSYISGVENFSHEAKLIIYNSWITALVVAYFELLLPSQALDWSVVVAGAKEWLMREQSISANLLFGESWLDVAMKYMGAIAHLNKELFIHTTVTCDQCNKHPIIGIRWKCSTCSDYDLCNTCLLTNNLHDTNHIFMKIENENWRKLDFIQTDSGFALPMLSYWKCI